MNTKPTTEVIRNTSNKLRRTAAELELICQRIEEYNDFSYVGEAINAIVNVFHNCRIDLFATRPIREYERELNKKEHKCICTDFINHNPDPVPNPDCPIHGSEFAT